MASVYSTPECSVPAVSGMSAERDWKEQLLDQLMNMRPDAFERLA
jgi:hypothetical protein